MPKQKQPKNCGTCNYSRQPGAISPDPKQDSEWCSNSESPRFMTYINLTNRCKEHQAPTPQQIEAAERFLKTADKLVNQEIQK